MIKKYLLSVALLLLIPTSYSQCFSSLSADGYHCLVLKPDGRFYGWGANNQAQLGTASTTSSFAIPTQLVPTATWSSIAAGLSSSIGIKSNGSLWGTGANNYGQIGIGTVSIGTSSFTRIGLDSDWAKVFGGTNQNFAIKTNGTLWGWGDNSEYELGNGGTAPSYTPIQITTTNDWNLISAGMHHVLALKNNGRLWVWGYNNEGQLGIGANVFQVSPYGLGTSTWLSVSAGHFHSMGVKSDGTLWGTGKNHLGQLGDGTNVNKTAFTQIGTDTNWQSVSCGPSYTIAIKTDGTMWAWGDNSYGQLGISSYTNKSTPTQVGTATTWMTVHTGNSHAIAMKTDGTIWVWGNNFYNQLGFGVAHTNDPRTSPTRLSTPSCNFLANDSFTQNAVVVYPNPVKDIVTIEADSYHIDTVIITDALGKEVLKETENTASVDLSSLHSGLYFIQCYSGDAVFIKKIIKY